MNARSEGLFLFRIDALSALPRFLDRINVRLDWSATGKLCPLEAFDGRPRFVPVQAAAALLDHVARKSGDDCFGVRFARFSGARTLLEMGDVLQNMPTLAAMIAASSRLIRYHTQGTEIRCARIGPQALWSYRLHPGVPNGRDMAHQLALVMMIDMMRGALGSRWTPRAVLLEQARPSSMADFDEAFGPNLRFRAGSNGILFDAALLASPMPQPTGVIRRGGDSLLAPLKRNAPAEGFSEALRQIILSLLPSGGPQIHCIAAACGLSTRTFQRMLQREGRSYSDLVDRIRLDEARRLLADPGIKLMTIALELGYSDQANFTHAFRRWTGTAPSEFRRSLCEMDGRTRAA